MYIHRTPSQSTLWLLHAIESVRIQHWQRWVDRKNRENYVGIKKNKTSNYCVKLIKIFFIFNRKSNSQILRVSILRPYHHFTYKSERILFLLLSIIHLNFRSDELLDGKVKEKQKELKKESQYHNRAQWKKQVSTVKPNCVPKNAGRIKSNLNTETESDIVIL